LPTTNGSLLLPNDPPYPAGIWASLYLSSPI
jgi:hypothetical protein